MRIWTLDVLGQRLGQPRWVTLQVNVEMVGNPRVFFNGLRVPKLLMQHHLTAKDKRQSRFAHDSRLSQSISWKSAAPSSLQNHPSSSLQRLQTVVTPFVCSWGKFQVSRHPIALSGGSRASVQIVSVVAPGNGSGKLSSTSGERKAIQAAVESYYALPGVPDDESLERSQSHIFSSCFLRFAALILEPVRRYVHTKSIKISDKEKQCRYMICI